MGRYNVTNSAPSSLRKQVAGLVVRFLLERPRQGSPGIASY
ncbi:hypothetical protein ACIOUE_22940 [Streptomyces xanthochromogenes]|nr:hypothetical protein [Streptomyces sp. SID1034]